MAKSRSFADKIKKGREKKDESKVIQLVFSYRSKTKNTWKYNNQLIKIPADVDEDKFLEEERQKSLARLTDDS